MRKLHFIHDFETLGVNSKNCVVINCGYLVFDADRFYNNPYTFKELVKSVVVDKFEVNHQVKDYGYKIDKNTLKWWCDLPEDVRAQIKPSDDDVDLKTFMKNLFDYIGNQKISFWWSRSNIFDPVILSRIAEDTYFKSELDDKLPYWAVRDVRTYIDAKTDFSLKYNGFCPIADEEEWNKWFQKHNVRHDVAADVLRMQRLIRFQEGLDE